MLSARRPRGRAIAACALALVLAAAGSAAAAGHSHRRSCVSRPGHTVLQNDRARLFRVKRSSANGPYRRLYGCLNGSPRQRALDDPNPEVEPETAVQLALAGRYAARSLESFDPNQTERYTRVAVTNLRSGRTRSADATAPSSGPSDVTVTSLVVAPSGSDAWIGANLGAPVANKDVYEVWRQAGTEAVQLDAGSGVDPASLALSQDGRTIYWTDSGAPRSAALPPG